MRCPRIQNVYLQFGGRKRKKRRVVDKRKRKQRGGNIIGKVAKLCTWSFAFTILKIVVRYNRCMSFNQEKALAKK